MSDEHGTPTNNPFWAIYQAIKRAWVVEKENLRTGLLRLRGRTDDESIDRLEEYYDEREGRLKELNDLLKQAARAGIAVGFTGEWLMPRIDAFCRRMTAASYWNENVETPFDDDWQAFCYMERLFARVWRAWKPLEYMAFVFAKPEEVDPASLQPPCELNDSRPTSLQPPVDLSELELDIWNALANGPLRGKAINSIVGNSETYVRAVLSKMLKKGVLRRGSRGYERVG